ncbi:hypothetical protein GLOIN_2v1876445 [Rhizophagus clarus]|uniref:F-box domain-containing protein n=1 Tax=Rhizophagus clarus TaxID=94130 RepID=A0A8H3MAP6_9GLOM|nr:hypothetical protein GLOIN_2v1876445 [Rhizophagus clarus]
MPVQLPVDCLIEIFEYLDDDEFTLYLCLLVNRLYCKIAVEILWRDVLDFQNGYEHSYKSHISLSIISTLIACLPKESKYLLHKNGIYITPNQKPPLFNYPSFCKTISIYGIDRMLEYTLRSRQLNNSGDLNHDCSTAYIDDIEFIYLTEAKFCLKNLAKLCCDSDSPPKFFYHMSQLCHNIQSLTIDFADIISNGLADLISSQNNLKRITLISSYYDENDKINAIIPSSTKFSLTLTELTLHEYYIPLSFVALFKNLQKLFFSFKYSLFDDFDQLQYVHFSQLKILKFIYSHPKIVMLIKFLEINGKNLTEFYIRKGHNNNSLNLAIVKFCPNLKILSDALIRNIGTNTK